jgi:hypothetical protein
MCTIISTLSVCLWRYVDKLNFGCLFRFKKTTTDELPNKEHVKDLGVTFSANLTFTVHYKKISYCLCHEKLIASFIASRIVIAIS